MSSPANPFRKRFGARLLTEAPNAPGLFWLRNHSNEVIYLGTSSNLRQRLYAYTHLKELKDPQKRALEALGSVEWQKTPSEIEAESLAQKIIKEVRPYFNSTKRSPPCYVELLFGERFHLTIRSDSAGKEVYGSFSQRNLTKRGIHSLGRLLWLSFHPNSSPLEMPSDLLRDRSPSVSFGGDLSPSQNLYWLELISSFFQGGGDLLLKNLRWQMDSRLPNLPKSLIEWIERDVKTLETFYQRGPRRNQEILSRFKLPKGPLSPEWHGDWLVELSRSQGARTRSDALFDNDSHSVE